ncbi:MAG: hypothetical protein V1800_07805 [Candidatus Latescibacterota bacterium]
MAEPKIPLKEMIERYRKLYGGPIMDVLDRNGLPNQWLHKSIKPLRLDTVIAGPAVTFLHTTRPKSEEQPPSPNLEEAVYPGCIVVVDPGKEQMSGHMGDITANSLAAKGTRGVVIDGGIRDTKNHLQIPDWGVFCKFTSPLEQGPREISTDVNVPVFMKGSLTIYVQVNPGDWIFGDCDGVVLVPKDMAEQVLIDAEEIVERENIARAKMREGMDPKEVREQYKVG